MPNPNAIVSQTIRLEIPPDRSVADVLRGERALTVELDGGQKLRLDAADPRSAGHGRVLEALSKRRLPVYVEFNPQSRAIERLLIPHVTRVAGISPAEGGGLSVELELSHARHFLRPGELDSKELEERLREGLAKSEPLIVTEDESHHIIDVRVLKPFPQDPTLPPLPPFPPFPPKPIGKVFLPWWKWWWHWPWWPWWWFKGCISPTTAQQAFDAMSATSCNPLTVPPPCIPFLYPDDGCWGRAHEMCRLMIAMGLKPRKVWIQGSLDAKTRNNPDCHVMWGWHVAPTLCVRQGWWIFSTQSMVIDPALFTTPVTQAAWKGVQGDPNASLTPTDASIYWLWTSGTDPTYAQTNSVLDFYRLMLQNRANQLGPPPYAACPP